MQWGLAPATRRRGSLSGFRQPVWTTNNTVLLGWLRLGFDKRLSFPPRYHWRCGRPGSAGVLLRDAKARSRFTSTHGYRVRQRYDTARVFCHLMGYLYWVRLKLLSSADRGFPTPKSPHGNIPNQVGFKMGFGCDRARFLPHESRRCAWVGQMARDRLPSR